MDINVLSKVSKLMKSNIKKYEKFNFNYWNKTYKILRQKIDFETLNVIMHFRI